MEIFLIIALLAGGLGGYSHGVHKCSEKGQKWCDKEASKAKDSDFMNGTQPQGE